MNLPTDWLAKTAIFQITSLTVDENGTGILKSVHGERVLPGLYSPSVPGSARTLTNGDYGLYTSDGFRLILPQTIPIEQQGAVSLTMDAEYDPMMNVPLQQGYRDVTGNKIEPTFADYTGDEVQLSPNIRLIAINSFNESHNASRFIPGTAGVENAPALDNSATGFADWLITVRLSQTGVFMLQLDGSISVESVHSDEPIVFTDLYGPPDANSVRKLVTTQLYTADGFKLSFPSKISAARKRAMAVPLKVLAKYAPLVDRTIGRGQNSPTLSPTACTYRDGAGSRIKPDTADYISGYEIELHPNITLTSGSSLEYSLNQYSFINFTTDSQDVTAIKKIITKMIMDNLAVKDADMDSPQATTVKGMIGAGQLRWLKQNGQPERKLTYSFRNDNAQHKPLSDHVVDQYRDMYNSKAVLFPTEEKIKPVVRQILSCLQALIGLEFEERESDVTVTDLIFGSYIPGISHLGVTMRMSDDTTVDDHDMAHALILINKIMPDKELYPTVSHEIGHALGLDHADDTPDSDGLTVMQPSRAFTSQLTELDIQVLREKHGPDVTHTNDALDDFNHVLTSAMSIFVVSPYAGGFESQNSTTALTETNVLGNSMIHSLVA